MYGQAEGRSSGTGSTWIDQLFERPEDSPSVVDSTGTWSTRDLLARAARAAAWLDEISAEPDTAVPALLWASPDSLALVIAGAATHRPIAPIGPLLTAAEVAAIVADMGGDVLVFDPAASSLAEGVANRSGRRATPFDIDAAGTADFVERPTTSPDDIAVVLHTSGTSGLPKRVELRQSILAARTRVAGQLLHLDQESRYVTAKPIHHIGGLGLTAAALGSGAAVLPMQKFDVESWALLEELAPTHASVVPAMIEMLLDSTGISFPSLRVLQYGGAPIRPATLERLLGSHPDLAVVSLYGQTEGSPIASLSADDHRSATGDRPDLLEAAGRATPGVELRIADPDSTGEGEILARAAHFARPTAEGWLHTGDLGRLDADGYLRITGRLGDVITRGGESVHPTEVERILAEHPAVADVAVAAVADDRLGETVGAWLVCAPGAARPADEELRLFVRSELAGFKVPTVWTWCEQIPRNPTGKIVRSRLGD